MYIKDPQQSAQACLIWMHGLGADAQNLMNVAEQLPLNIPVRHVFLEAPMRPITVNNYTPMRAWYDIVGFDLTDREDREGINDSEQMIERTIEAQQMAGFKPQQIFLIGFSQGGAMALYAGLRHRSLLGGVVALSGYLPFASENTSARCVDLPIFMAAGQFDNIVHPHWTKKTYSLLQNLGLERIGWYEYPIDHTICLQEIRDLALWLEHQIVNMTKGEA